MLKLSNVRIGKKLALILAIGIGSVLCVGAISLWALRAIRGTNEQQQIEADKLASAQRVGTDLGLVNAVVGHITLNEHCETCHETAAGGPRAAEERMAIESRSLMSALKAGENTPEGKKLAGDLDSIGTAWLDANLHVLELGTTGKKADALESYRDDSIPNVGPFQASLEDYLKLQQSRFAERKQHADTVARQMPIPIALFSLLAAVFAILLGWAISRSIVKPLIAAVAHLDQVAGGEVSRDVPQEFLDRRDEIGGLGRGMQKMTVALRTMIQMMIQEVSGGIQVLSTSSTALMDTSTQMTSDSHNASEKAHSVSAAAEEMSANISSVATGMEEATKNLSRVALATEQMTSTIGEIAQNSDKARRITDEATQQAGRITEQINQLGGAAIEIGKITETITEISSQTNLLALNATIEAARAGSAGKGFAVVASEIKALAQQTAAATEDIKGRIAGVQSATSRGVAEIGKISKVIADVSAIVDSIAAAIEQQSSATKDIASNIAEASNGVTEASARVSETSKVSREIAKDIVGVDQAVEEMASGSNHIRTKAGELSSVADSLQVTVARFHA